MHISRVSRYLMTEVGLSWLAVTVVLMVVLLTNRFIHFLADAASGNIPANLLFVLLGLKALANLGTVLPASFFLAIVMALGRLYRDSEMAALTACGVGPRELLRGLLLLAVPLALLVGYLSLVFGPWAEHTAQRMVAQAQQSDRLQGVFPGRFLDLGSGQAVAYVASVDAKGIMHGIFARAEQGGEPVLVVAKRARRKVDPASGNRFLVLLDGRRYQGVPGQRAWRVIRFRQHGLSLGGSGPVHFTAADDALTSWQLWHSSDRAARAQLQWRLSMPLVTLVLTLLALPLSKSTPREGRYAKLLLAVLAYMLYFNLLKVAQGLLSHGRYPEGFGLWWVHVLMLGIALAALQLRFQILHRVQPDGRRV
ncbi:MAG TPA: LPS export ABC transporter permease LptF [Nitrococcus sp.]|nr:LPS export ABC transporter permease LptF [Nitrococcus sp.]